MFTNTSTTAPPLSALAARRLRSQEAILQTPETGGKSAGEVAASKNASPGPSTTVVSANCESEGVGAKRRQIEGKLKDQLKAQAQIRPRLEFGSPGLDESALVRARKRNGEIINLAAELVDDEMVDVSELVELGSEDEVMEGGVEKIQVQVNLSHSRERFVTQKLVFREATRMLTDGNIARHQNSHKAPVSFLLKRTTAQMQTVDK